LLLTLEAFKTLAECSAEKCAVSGHEPRQSPLSRRSCHLADEVGKMRQMPTAGGAAAAVDLCEIVVSRLVDLAETNLLLAKKPMSLSLRTLATPRPHSV
jgi:hypothetical protein